MKWQLKTSPSNNKAGQFRKKVSKDHANTMASDIPIPSVARSSVATTLAVLGQTAIFRTWKIISIHCFLAVFTELFISQKAKSKVILLSIRLMKSTK